MPKTRSSAIVAYSTALAVGLAMILWWCCVEYLWLVPKAKKAARDAAKILTVDSANFRTGDLLFFRGLSWAEKAIQTYTKNRYNHVSMVIKEKGKIFLWEADVGEYYRQGPRVIPLDQKLSRWRGTSEIARRPIKKEISEEEILKIAGKEASKEFDKSMLIWLFSWWPREEGKYFCSELIAETLKRVGVLTDEKRSSAYSPKDLATGEMVRYDNLYVVRN